MRRLTLSLIGAIGLGAFLFLTARTIGSWQSTRTVWTAAHRQSPRDVRPLINLAVDAIERDDFSLADRLLTEADAALDVSRDGQWTEGYIVANRASLLIRSGHWDEAQTLVKGTPTTHIARRLCVQYRALC